MNLFSLIGILRALVRIAQELKRIREILEIAHKDALSLHDLYKNYTSSDKDSDKEFIAKEPDLDFYEIIDAKEKESNKASGRKRISSSEDL
jgi:hypothetical protein